MKTYQLVVLLGFVIVMDVALFSLVERQAALRKNVERLNDDLERTDRHLARVEKELDYILIQAKGIQGPRWQCVPGMIADAGNGNEACVWVDTQSVDGGIAGQH